VSETISIVGSNEYQRGKELAPPHSFRDPWIRTKNYGEDIKKGDYADDRNWGGTKVCASMGKTYEETCRSLTGPLKNMKNNCDDLR